MKLDKIKFAQLIGWITNCTGYTFSNDQVACIDDAVDFPDATQYVDCVKVDDLLKQMVLNEKIPAIKAYRVLTGVGLKEAKDAVEKYWVSKTIINSNHAGIEPM